MSDWIDIQKDTKHISREKSKAGSLKKNQWWKNRLAEGECHYCKCHFSADELTMDHVVPLSRGGKSTKGNVVPCCKACNKQKKYLTPAEILLNKLRDDETNL